MTLEYGVLNRNELRQATEQAARSFSDYEYFTNWFPEQEERARVEIFWSISREMKMKTTNNRHHPNMKRMIIVILSLIPPFAMAQEPQIIGGYLLDGKDSFEELEAAILTESKSKEKNLGGKGMKFPGGRIFMTPESVGKEIGSLVKARHPFLVKTICFTIEENRMEGCKASLRIYRMDSEDNLMNIVTMPIYQDIPKATEQTTFSIAPEESIVLDPGEYYISFCLTEISQEIMDRWAESESWSDEKRFDMYRHDRVYFPLYLKSSFTRERSAHPLTKWGGLISALR